MVMIKANLGSIILVTVFFYAFTKGLWKAHEKHVIMKKKKTMHGFQILFSAPR